MKSGKRQQEQKNQGLQDGLQNQEGREGVSAQNDGFRYDYDDSSDVEKDL